MRSSLSQRKVPLLQQDHCQIVHRDGLIHRVIIVFRFDILSELGQKLDRVLRIHFCSLKVILTFVEATDIGIQAGLDPIIIREVL